VNYESWPVTFNQSRVLSRLELSGGAAGAGPPSRVDVIRVEGRVSHDVLTEALACVVRRHGALRATFRPNRRIPPTARDQMRQASRQTGLCYPELYEQVVGSTSNAAVEHTDCQGLGAQERRTYISRVISGYSASSPTTPPHLRVSMLRFSDTSAVLIIAISWLVADPVSQDLVCAELATHYRTILAGGEAPSRAPQFHSFAVWQNEQVYTTCFSDAQSHWSDVWARVETSPLLIENIRGARTPDSNATNGGDSLVVTTGTKIADAVRRYSRDACVSPTVVFIAAYVVLLGELTGRGRLPLWMSLPNRLFGETEDVIGWLSNFHLVEFDLINVETADAVVERCRSTLVTAQAHQAMPLPLLWRRIGRVAERLRMARMVFEWKSAFLYDADGTVFVREAFHVPDRRAPVGLHLTVTDQRDEYVVEFAYPIRCFEPTSIQTYASRYLELVASITASSDPHLDLATFCGSHER
jgi:hypothetical protein